MSRYKEFDEYEELIKERLSKKRFTHSMNVAEACYDLAERFGVESIPTLVIIKDGITKEVLVGLHRKEQILEQFN